MTLASPDESVQQIASRPPPLEAAATPYDATEFTELGDQLVRKLFDTGLRLDVIRMAFDRAPLTPAELDEHRAAIVDILANLDTMIRATGTAMLTLTAATPMGELRRRRRR